MGYEIAALKSGRSTEAPVAIDQLSQLEAMEATQRKIAPYLPTGSNIDVSPLKGIPADIQEEALAIVDKICEEVGHEPLSRRLSKLLWRISVLAEDHILKRKQEQHKEKVKIEVNVQDQKSCRGWQATSHGGAGFGAALLTIAGAISGDNTAGKIFSGLSALCSPADQMFTSSLEGKLVPLSHESQLFLGSSQSEKQAVEGLKNLPESIRNLVLELTRLESRAFESLKG